MAKANKTASEEKPKKPARKTQDAAAKTKAKSGAAKKTSSKPRKKAAGDKAAASSSVKLQGSGSKATTNETAADSSTAKEATPAGVLDPAMLPAQRGKVGVFGGPKDRGIKPDDKLALPTGRHFTFERVRSLNPKSFYVAMRWDYHILGKSIGEGQRWWANKKLLVTNPTNGISVVLRAVDYGPPDSTGLDIAVSPGAAEALGVEIGDEVEIAFADPRLPAGVVE